MRRKGIIGAGAIVLLVAAGAVVAVTTGDREPPGVASAASGGRDERRAAAPGPDVPAVNTPDTGGTGAVGETAAGRGGDAVALAPSAGGVPAAVDPAGPRIVRTAEITVEVGEGSFGAAFDRVAAIASIHGGYVTASSTFASDDGGRARSGQLTLRVPSDRFEEARQALGRLGEVERESLRGEDVSAQLVDYEARLRSLRAQEEALRTLLGRAEDVGEVLQVQTALFNVRQQIEQLEAQRSRLEQAASLATIQVSLYEPGAALVPDPRPEPATGLARSLERAVDAALAVVGGMVVVVGALAPLAVLGLLGWAGYRVRRRARPATSGPAAPATS